MIPAPMMRTCLDTGLDILVEPTTPFRNTRASARRRTAYHTPNPSPSAGAVLGRGRSRPVAQRAHVRRRALAEPAVELGLVLELLPAAAGDDEEAAGDLRDRRHVAPQLLPLGDGEDV